MDVSRSSWIAKAEAAIRALRDVESTSIQSDGETIREIHVLTRSGRPPKQIVRDVQTVLLTCFNRTIDYRVVSVAYLDQHASLGGEEPPAAPPPRAPGAAGGEPAASAVPEPAPAPEPESPAPAVQRASAPAVEPVQQPAEQRPERIRFASVNLFAAGHRTQAQVELRWRGLPRMGSASGWSTRNGAHRLVAEAALAAVQEFLADEVAISVQAVEFLRLGRSRVVVVSLCLLVGRQEKLLVGTCAVEQDLQQAVVCATLAALNRIVAGLRPKEATEYILRPTSAQ